MTHQIKVLNKNRQNVTDYFDGLPYHFNFDEPVNIPLDAARHIFGVDFPADAAVCASTDLRARIMVHLQKRWGWNSHNRNDSMRNDKTFAGFTFTPVVFQQVELVSKAEEEPAAPREAKLLSPIKTKKPVEDDEEEVA